MKIAGFFKTAMLLAMLCSATRLTAAPLQVATPLQVSEPADAIPPNIVTEANKPMIMLTASKDHLLFGPVYNDFEDLDGDEIPDVTFKPTFEYYGYFDASKCYSYKSAEKQFEPAEMALRSTVTVDNVTLNKYTCRQDQSYWSGNFLNWVTMTRLDTMRKMLYGGYRDKDSRDSTVLMGSRLVWDAHSFVKYYRGDDIRDYTPFSKDDLTKRTGSNAYNYAGLSICVTGSSEDPWTSQPVMRMVKGNVRFWATVELMVCRWRDEDNYLNGTFGPKLARAYSSPELGNGGVNHEVSIPSKSADGASYSGIDPELFVRVKVCDSKLLGDERCQAFPPNSTSNFKPYGLLQEFGYPKTSDEAARAEFGLISGSYDKKNTAGALRKNIGDLEDEIDRETGVFCHSPGSGCRATLADGRSTGAGIIKTFDSIILYGRRDDHSYGSQNVPSISSEIDLPAWGNPAGEMLAQALQYYAYNDTRPTPTNPIGNEKDRAVGMPKVDWKDPLADSEARKKKYGNAVCRPLNILAFSSSAPSFDGQANGAFQTLPNLPNLPNSSDALDSYVDKIGEAEGIHRTWRSVGSTSGTGLTDATDKNSCSAKYIEKLSQVNGICPEAPAMGGTYQIAGAALYGNTTRIRNPTNLPADLGKIENALHVRTMAASLSGGAPRIEVLVPGTNKYVYITPESVQDGGKVSAPLTFASISSGDGETPGSKYGSYIVTWNDILMGGDYDMDITGFIRYNLYKSPSGWKIDIISDIPGVCGGGAGTHGYSVIGVQHENGNNANGRYLTHQHTGGNTTSRTLLGMPDVKEYLCGDETYRNQKISFTDQQTYADTVCNVTGNGNSGDSFNQWLAPSCTVKNRDFPVTMTFKAVGEENALLKPPLWYAGKYGSFKSSVKNSDGSYSTVAMPPNLESWDNTKADGSFGHDGIPDGYFLARRPELLEAQLHKALYTVAKNSNAAPAIASAQMVASGHKYVVKFDSSSVSGALEAYKINSEGEFSATPEWEAGSLLQARASANSGNDRSIITNFGNGENAGMKFRWNALHPGYKFHMMNVGSNKLTMENAERTLNYIRGDQTLEGPNGLRQRYDSLLGPVVNGTPWIQGHPSATLAGIAADGYRDFFNDNKQRQKLLWVSANDGMLHAFNPETGAEVFAYVPGVLANRLAEIPMQRGTAARTKLNGRDFVNGAETLPRGTVWPYVDGNSFSADVKIGRDWKTYVFGSLGRGGRAVYALDATKIDQLTEANADKIFKWQFTANDDPDLGYITGDVSIHPLSNQAMPVAKMNNGKYALLLGNGNKSPASPNSSALFILYLEGPDGNNWFGHYRKIVASTGPGNGLSAVRWEDIDGNGTADVAYAGDLRGNLWKFDLSSDDPEKWDVAYKLGGVNQPLYTARYMNASRMVTALPITTAPQLLYMAQGGFMVNFATGNAFGEGDFPKPGVVQRVYGIWDRPGMGTAGGRALPRGLATLAPRSYSRNSEGVVTVGSGETLDWSWQDGWYFNLPGNAEAVLSDPVLDAGILTFVTVRAKDGNANECSSTPKASLYTVDPISGRAERNTQGTITVNNTEVVAAAKEIGDQKVRVVNDRTKKPFTRTCRAGEAGCTCVGTDCTKNAPICQPGQRAKRVTGRSADAVLCTSSAPRLQWREIPGLRTDQ